MNPANPQPTEKICTQLLPASRFWHPRSLFRFGDCISPILHLLTIAFSSKSVLHRTAPLVTATALTSASANPMLLCRTPSSSTSSSAACAQTPFPPARGTCRHTPSCLLAGPPPPPAARRPPPSGWFCSAPGCAAVHPSTPRAARAPRRLRGYGSRSGGGGGGGEPAARWTMTAVAGAGAGAGAAGAGRS